MRTVLHRALLILTAITAIGADRTAQAQYAYGYSSLSVTAYGVYSSSATDLDYVAQAYYAVESDAYLYAGNAMATSGYGTTVSLYTPVTPNQTYWIQTNHWVIPYGGTAPDFSCVSGGWYAGSFGVSACGWTASPSTAYIGTSYASGDSYNLGSPPSISSIDQTTYGTAQAGTSGYVILYGTNLAPPDGSTSVGISGGISSSVTSASQGQVNVYYFIPSSTPAGYQTIYLSTSYGSTAASFYVYPAPVPPVITGVDQTTYGTAKVGTSGYVILYGTNLTTSYGNTTVSIGDGISSYVQWQSQNQVNVWYSIPSNAATGRQTIYLGTSAGSTTTTFTVYPTLSPQTITFNQPPDVAYGIAPFTLAATASSGLPVNFTSNTPAVCTISAGSTVTIIAVGTCTITASQAGNATYAPAANMSQSFFVIAPALTTDFRGAPPPGCNNVSPFNLYDNGITQYNCYANVAYGQPVPTSCSTSNPNVTITVASANSISTTFAFTANANAAPGPITLSCTSSAGSLPFYKTCVNGCSGTITVNVYDVTPQIQTMTPNVVTQSVTPTPIVFTGYGFGATPPVLQISPPLPYTISSYNPIGQNPYVQIFTALITPVAAGTYSISIQSSGNGANGFVASGTPPSTTNRSNPMTLTILAKPPTIYLCPPEAIYGCSAGSGGTDITTTAHPDPIKVVVGQQIILSGNVDAPAGTTVQSQSWSVPGSTVGGYNASAIAGQQVIPAGFNGPSTLFYWYATAAGQASVNYTVTFAATMTNGAVAIASANFIVEAPTAPNVQVMIGLPTTVQFSNPTRYSLGLGGVPPGYGIVFTPSITAPPDFSGNFVWGQVIDALSVTWTPDQGSPTVCPATNALDVAFPYPARSGSDPNAAVDSPNMRLATSGLSREQFQMSSHMYLLWQPVSASPAIPVPVGSVQWQWYGDALYDPLVLPTQWAVQGDSSAGLSQPVFAASSTFPTWNSVFNFASSCPTPPGTY